MKSLHLGSSVWCHLVLSIFFTRGGIFGSDSLSQEARTNRICFSGRFSFVTSHPPRVDLTAVPSSIPKKNPGFHLHPESIPPFLLPQPPVGEGKVLHSLSVIQPGSIKEKTNNSSTNWLPLWLFWSSIYSPLSQKEMKLWERIPVPPISESPTD